MNSRNNWEQFQLADDKIYEDFLEQVDPHQVGIGIGCPLCLASSWIKLPAHRQGTVVPLSICCPKACGYYGLLGSFTKLSLNVDQILELDSEYVCSRDGTVTRALGRFQRCPFCGYENSREIMRDLRITVQSRVEIGNLSRDDLSDLLGRIVSTFDGVMRACNSAAVNSAARGSPYNMTTVRSFQNLAGARTAMLPFWDIAANANDWDKFVQMFQKRHCFAHSLGIVDQGYLDKSGDKLVKIGQNVGLNAQELLECSKEAENLVGKFFAQFFS